MGEQDITDLQPDNRTEVEKQLDSIAVRRKIVPNPHFQEPTLTQMVLHEPEKNATDEPEVIQEQRESILTMGSKLLDKSGKRKRGLHNRLVAGTIGAGLGTMVHLVRTGTIQKWIGGPHAEFFKKQQDVKNQGEDITQDLVMQEQKEGVDYGDNFNEKNVKEEGSTLFQGAHKAIEGVFIYDAENPNSGLKADSLVGGVITQAPLTFEPDAGKLNYDRIFNRQNWSIAQELFFAALEDVAKEKGINLDSGGLESWLISHGRDSVLTATVNNSQQSINCAHLMQILWNEYKSTDNIPISPADQLLLKQYWQGTGRTWVVSGGRIERQHKLSWEFVQQIFEMAQTSGANPEAVVGNGLTLQAELEASPGQAEIKALDMAQASLGATSFDSITGTILGLMMVIGFGRKRLTGIFDISVIKQRGEELLQRLKQAPEIIEEVRVKENSRRLVNRLKHGLSLSRKVVLDLGAVLLNPDNQDMRDLILTEGPNWFRHVPENHPEIRQIIGFFNCQTYQGLQNLARRPELISPRLEQLLTLKFKEFNERGAGRERGMKLKTQEILPENARKLIELYQASAGE